MPEVPARVLREVFSSRNPLADTITVAGREIRCYVQREYAESTQSITTESLVATIPAYDATGIEVDSAIMWKGVNYNAEDVQHEVSEGVVRVFLREV